MVDLAAPRGWAFLVARGRRKGYRVLLVPGLLADSNQQGVLAEALSGGSGPREAPTVETITAAGIGPVSCAYRTERFVEAALDGDPGRALLDEHGRPLEILYGVACATEGILNPDAADLDIARADALATYGRFLADEAGFTAERSEPFVLRSTISPSLVSAATPGVPHQLVESGPTAPDLAVEPVPPPSAGRGLVVAGVAALSIALATGAWLFLLRSPDEPELTVEVKQPNVEDLECGRLEDIQFEAVLSADGEMQVTYHWEDAPADASVEPWQSKPREVTVDRDGPQTVDVSRRVRITAGETVRKLMTLVVDRPNPASETVEYTLTCDDS